MGENRTGHMISSGGQKNNSNIDLDTLVYSLILQPTSEQKNIKNNLKKSVR